MRQRYRLPSLNALRDFEAVGRHGSVSAAARELSVSPSAVSRQVALLEQHFGRRLFDRRPTGLALTERGRRYFETISEAFARIDTASERMAGKRGRRIASRLTTHVYSSFATEWLVARLPDFRARHPEIEFRLNASGRSVDFATDEVDVGFLLGPQIRPELHQDVLYRLRFTPMASPALLRRSPLRRPEDLAHQTVIYSELEVRHWHAWCRAAAVRGIDPERGLRFDSSTLTYRAARDGAGVVLGQPLLLAEDLAQGRLVAPFEQLLASSESVCLACPRERLAEPPIAAFRQWLISEVRRAELAPVAQPPSQATAAAAARSAVG